MWKNIKKRIGINYSTLLWISLKNFKEKIKALLRYNKAFFIYFCGCRLYLSSKVLSVSFFFSFVGLLSSPLS